MRLRFPVGSTNHQHPINVRQVGRNRTTGEQVADAVAARVGSWPFIIVQSVLLVLWIIANGFLVRDWLGGKPFDPYPFILLNLMLVPGCLHRPGGPDESESPGGTRSGRGRA